MNFITCYSIASAKYIQPFIGKENSTEGQHSIDSFHYTYLHQVVIIDSLVVPVHLMHIHSLHRLSTMKVHLVLTYTNPCLLFLALPCTKIFISR